MYASARVPRAAARRRGTLRRGHRAAHVAGLDPPDFGSPHNNASDTNLFGRFTLPLGLGNVANVTLIHSFQTFQIPNDVTHGEPAATDDNETQEDDFLSAQFRHPIGDSGVLTFGPALKVSRIRDFGDPANDFTYGEALNVLAPPFGNGGSPTRLRRARCRPATSHRRRAPSRWPTTRPPSTTSSAASTSGVRAATKCGPALVFDLTR